MSTSGQTKNDLPFRQIPDYPEIYTPATVIARMIDGLGFRYYWATEGLKEKDLEYRPSDEARTSEETIDHILSLCLAASNTIKETSTKVDISAMGFDEKRRLTLETLKKASDLLHQNPDMDLESKIFKTGKLEFPFWNIINGQLSDALWHVGQVVSFRRSSGNPINPNVSVFSGVLVE
ncbi:MAG: hypothetical protein ACFHWX_08930 [Bacteroidota bacterium]